MSTHFGAILDIESAVLSALRDPPPSHQKKAALDSPLELDDLSPVKGNVSPLPTALQTPTIPYTGAGTYFPSEATTPQRDEAVGFAPSFSYPAKNKWRVFCSCLTFFGNGCSDGAAGALLPYIEKHYGIGYAIVSLIFVTTAVGFISAAFLNDWICGRLGRSRSLMLAETLLIIGNVLLVCTPPFPIVVLAFYFLGFAFAITLALYNVFVGTLADSTVLLGFCQGAYGIGATVAPIIATVMVSAHIHWSRFYLVTLGIRVACLAAAGWAWHGYESEMPTRFRDALERTASLGSPRISKLQRLGDALRNPVTLYGALYTFAYQGAEVSISGWVISFLITYRHGEPGSVGYVTAGFWGGITVGRFCLSHLINRLGERRSLFGLVAGAILFQVIAWQVPNVIGDAVAVSLVGLLLGPIAPCSTVLFLRLLDPRMQTSSVSFISSAGSSGGAVAPFLTGLVAQAAGTWMLHPICIALFVVMLGCWVGLPREKKRDE